MILKLFIFALAAITLINFGVKCDEDLNYDDLFIKSDDLFEAVKLDQYEARSFNPGGISIQVEDPWEDVERCELNQKCVPYYLCKDDGEINDDGSFLIDERLDNDGEVAGETCPSLEQCCLKKDVVSDIEPECLLDPDNCEIDPESSNTEPTTGPNSKGKKKPTSPSSATTAPTTGGNSKDKKKPTGPGSSTKAPPTVTNPNDKEIPGIICSAISQLAVPKKCGIHNAKGILGTAKGKAGSTIYAQYGEFPWMMAILLAQNVNGSTAKIYQSGGSLIAPNVVLTTAHNLAGHDTKKIIVRAGEWDTQSKSEICPHDERAVIEVIPHEHFTRKNLQNNLALLILDKPFKLSPVINTICLPPQNHNFDNQRCLSSGWGKTKFGKAGAYQAYLKKVDLPVIPNGKCQEQFRQTRLGPDFVLNSGFLCAGGEEGKDLCTGDGGSPLVCPIKSSSDQFYQSGIVAGGIGCGTKDVPGFYTKVAKYRSWIDKKFQEKGLDSKYYKA